jgi:transposase-like protein
MEAIDDTFYSISEQDSIIGYLAVTDAPSKFHRFDYYILFDDKEDILKVEILNYRENYGAEICSKRWLKQFVGIDTKNSQSYNNSVDAISGATISVNSLKYDLLKTCKSLKLKL